MGSMVVISKAKDARLPAAEPRPGPTGIPLSFAYLTKSMVMRKYPAKPIFLITPNS